MKKWLLFFILSGIIACAGAGNLYALDNDDQKADEVSAKLDADTQESGEAQKVTQRLTKEFNVTQEQVDGLRNQGMGFGEIGIALSLAKQMPGGANDQNIKSVMDMRQGTGGQKEGWGKIAKDLNVQMGPAIKSIAGVETKARISAGQDASVQSDLNHGRANSNSSSGLESSSSAGSGGMHGNSSANVHAGVGGGRMH